MFKPMPGALPGKSKMSLCAKVTPVSGPMGLGSGSGSRVIAQCHCIPSVRHFCLWRSMACSGVISPRAMRFRSWPMVAGHSVMTHLLQRLLKVVGISGLVLDSDVQARQSFSQTLEVGGRESQAQRLKSRLGLLGPIAGCWYGRVREGHLVWGRG